MRLVLDRNFDTGWSLVELLFTLCVASIMAAIAIPETQNIVRNFRLDAAVASVTGAIESTRYHAIMRGYPYQVRFDPGAGTYQVFNKPPGTSDFAAVGGAIPISGLADATLSPAAQFQFNPGGTVKPAEGGGSVVQISNGNLTKTITVSGVGQVQVAP